MTTLRVRRRSGTQQAAIVLLLSLALAGCATIFNDTSPEVDISSNPDGARVYVDGSYVGMTPVMIELSTKEGHTVVFRKEGFEDRTYYISNSIGWGWVMLDLFALLPILVDAATGAWFMLDTNSVNINWLSSDGVPITLETMDVEAGRIGPTLTVDLHNTSSKTVRAVSLWATFTDGHGDTVVWAEEKAAKLIWQRHPIPPGKTVSARWSISRFELALTVDRSGICRVTFSDGTEWKAVGESNCPF